MADFLDEKRREIGDRLAELRPFVDEFDRLQAAANALGSVPGENGAPTRQASRTRNAKLSSSRRPAASRRGRGRGRPKGSGTRSKEALQLVKANPGITVPGIADKMGIKENYLYRVLGALAEDGLVTKEGRGWHPKQVA